MLTIKTIMSQVKEGDWFVTIDLKDAYFHIQVVRRHRRFLRFAFGGKAYQYKVLPFGLALTPRTFTKCMDAALAPLRLQTIRVLNYLDDWLILAHSRELVSRHRDIVLSHIHSLGLRMNAKKSVLLPSQRTVFLGVRLDSVQMQARLAPARISDLTFTFTFMHLADAFIQSDLQLHSGYTFSLVCVPWESNPQPFALLTQCSTTEPHRNTGDADDKNHHVSGQGGRLVCHHRPEGCVFSHPGRSKTQEVPSVCLWREGLPIQGPALRPGFDTENVYEMHGCCTGPFEAPEHSCTELSGRLAHSGSLQGASESSQGYLTACLARFKLGYHVSVGTCRRLMGLMAAASPVLPLGLLHMRPFLWWMKELRLHPTVPATCLIRVSRSCCRPLLLWREPVFLRSGVRMGAIHRRHMITTDASMTGWGAVFEGRQASGEWKEEFLSWHINCLELRAVFLALKYFLPVLGGIIS